MLLSGIMEKSLDSHGRWRNKIVAFRVSEEEARIIDDKVALSGLTKQEYIIRRLCEKKMTSKVIRLIKQARKYHKRLVVVADSCESEFIELLFDGVIALSFNSDRERSCNVYTPSRHRNTDNIYAR